MYDLPVALYVGSDAAAVADAWAESGDGLTVRGATPGSDVAERLAEGGIDAVVCDCDGSFDGRAAVEAVRDHSASLPVVALSVGDALSLATATDLGVESYLQVDADTDRVELLANLRSLIERRRETRLESTMLASLLENVPLSVYFKDRRSRHVRVSDEMARLTGPPYLEAPDGKRHHAPEDLVGKTDFDLYPPDLSEDAVADDRHVVETGESVDGRVEHAHGDNLEESYVTTSKAPWRDEHGAVLGVVGVTRDITERKRYENQLERQNERLQRFASVVSHDVRNPLEVALGRLEFARADGDDEHFEAIERSLHRIDALIEDVLTLAREGEAVSDPEPVDLGDVARRAWTVVETGDATLTVETDATLLADASRLQQLLENVVCNAVEHGGEDVTITVGDLGERQGFFVADDGAGVPEAHRDSVFDAGYSTDDDGTGLGLSIVRTIAEAHGWETDVTESESGGARFEFGDVTGGGLGEGADDGATDDGATDERAGTGDD
ncbi:PAS/PAC sensor signal transduction histidine kinase [Halosimplex carlsbadense 2-9-1]|uniref:histidine kinase n=1 Tax=Halosimplex carlsbadense 2-9-1 TaxID=797114 RepID=M0D0I7_9EURY|nr:PAS domain-containing sensor histidine kinase [Halosimplex carlsbadense]ELZ27659.1 PAS/PAC sensor signal transduction histidine kinase [Halosimplex carlsbadense 2-9-1]